MNQGFKLRFDQMREGQPTPPADDASGDGHTYYDTPGYGRNLCLVWPEGRQMFFNYAYLIAAEFEPGETRNEIRLNFSSCKVHLRGFGLASLFTALLDGLPRQIVCTDARYATGESADTPQVIEVDIINE